MDPTSVDFKPYGKPQFEEDCIGDQLIIFMSVKTTPLIWKMLDDEVVFAENIDLVFYFFNEVHEKRYF